MNLGCIHYDNKKRRNRPRLLQHRERKDFPAIFREAPAKNATQVKRNKFNILWTFIIKEFVKNPELHKIFIGIILLKKFSCKHGLRWISRTSSWSPRQSCTLPALHHAKVINFVNHAAKATSLKIESFVTTEKVNQVFSSSMNQVAKKSKPFTHS